MQSKQLALQNKLEQLGKECTLLRTELNTAVLGKEETNSTLSEVEQKCHNLYDKLAKEEVCLSVCLLVRLRELMLYLCS